MNHGPSMSVAELHTRIDEIASRAFFHVEADADAEVSAAEAHASAGCSVCARALVNARDLGADFAFLAPPAVPSAGSRDRLLERARRSSYPPPGAPAVAAAGRASANPELLRPSAAPISSGREPRVFDPSATVAHMHLSGLDEAERALEIEELGAHIAPPGDPTERVLAQIERILGFPLHFVSIIRGDRIIYRVQRGLPSTMKAFPGMRREMTFCTHCVSSGAPLLVKNAGAEPFFRGNPAVSRHRIRAYAGVPLRTSKGIIVGTLCALDYRPRAITQELVRVLSLFAQRVVAEIEKPRSTALIDALIVDPPQGLVYRRAWFEELLGVELSRASSEGRSAALIAVSGCSSADIASIAAILHEDEVAGQLADGSIGILLSGATEEQAKARCAALSSCGSLDVEFNPDAGDGPISVTKRLHFAVTMADRAFESASSWIGAALSGRSREKARGA